MLPGELRLRRSAQFARVIKHGMKTTRRCFVMYAATGQAQFGLIVGKSVGGAVQRNRVKRRLRHLAATMMNQSSPLSPMTVVVRALPAAVTEPKRLGGDFISAWQSCAEALR